MPRRPSSSAPRRARMATYGSKQKPATEDDDIRKFVLHEHKVRTIEGDLVSVPKCSWGKEMKILALLKDIIKAVIDSGVLGGKSAEADLDPEVAMRAAQAQLRINKAQEMGDEPNQEDIDLVAVVEMEART